MKTLKLLIFLLFIPLVFHAQKSLTGLWTGTLSNDSTTVRKDQSFEIALTQYKEKVYGYSRMNFIINDTLYYIVKRVRGTIENDVCEVTDDDIITHNYPRKPDKGVKLISTFRRNLQDSVWRLDGEWKTTQSKTRKYLYYSISGKISLKSEPDIGKSKIFPHLEELNLANDVAFYKESKKVTQVAIAQNQQKPDIGTTDVAATKNAEKKQIADPVIAKSEPQKSGGSASTALVTESKNDILKTPEPEVKKQEAAAKREEPQPASEETVAFTGLKKSELPASNLPAEQKKNVTGNTPKPEIENRGVAIKINETVPVITEQQTAIKKSDPTTIAKSNEEKKIIPAVISQPEIKKSSAAAFVQQRKTVAPQILEFKSDSLELKLYDNGEVDGDTVSILLNGEILLAKQGLKTTAIKKTIYIQPGSDEITLVLYAENLGKYPPNTGLLIIHDGEDDYQVRFSADLHQNAAITLRRKK